MNQNTTVYQHIKYQILTVISCITILLFLCITFLLFTHVSRNERKLNLRAYNSGKNMNENQGSWGTSMDF